MKLSACVCKACNCNITQEQSYEFSDGLHCESCAENLTYAERDNTINEAQAKQKCHVCDEPLEEPVPTLNGKPVCNDCMIDATSDDEKRHVREEGVNFDKFMDNILLKEQKEKKVSESDETPQRKIAKLYREKSHNRIKFNNGSK